MKRIAIMLALFVLTSAALGSAEALARGHRGHGPMGEGGPGMGFNVTRMLDRLDFSQEQERKVAQILKSHRDEIAKVMADAAEARSTLRQAMHAATYPEGGPANEAQKVAATHVEMILLRAKIMNEIRSVMNEDQIQRFQEFGHRRADRSHGAVDSRLAGMDRWIAEHSE